MVADKGGDGRYQLHQRWAEGKDGSSPARAPVTIGVGFWRTSNLLAELNVKHYRQNPLVSGGAANSGASARRISASSTRASTAESSW